MDEYLGETPIKISKTEYALYSQKDWALLWIEKYGAIDGAHHKAWVIDQVARILQGTKVTIKVAKWSNGKKEYRFNLEEPTEEYLKWTKKIGYGEDDYGIAP